jgi:hypothetical protein
MDLCPSGFGIAIWVASLQSHTLLFIRGGFCKVASTSGNHMENLLASPGAIVSIEGKLARIPTLVPQKKRDQTCKFLDAKKRCAIHIVNPYGCGFFHYGMSQQEADLRSSRGLQAIAREWAIGGLYARIWMLLHTAGLVAPCPIEARSRLRKAIATRQSH